MQGVSAGHSLGGALATLAAFAVSSAAQELGIEGRVNMCCYTFGWALLLLHCAFWSFCAQSCSSELKSEVLAACCG